MFHFQGMFSGIIKALILGFCFVCLLVWSFFKKSICHFSKHVCTLFFLLTLFPSFLSYFFPSFLLFLHFSPQSHRVCCSLFVVWAIIQNAGLSSDRHWSKEMRNDLHSLAPLHFHLPYYYQTHARPTFTLIHPRARVLHALTQHALSQMISEVSSAKRHPDLESSERFFVNVHTPWHTVHLVDFDTRERWPQHTTN